MFNNKAFWFGILGVVFFITSTILGGLNLLNYSHISNLISESYANGTAYGTQLRFFGFIPSGIFIAIFAFLAIKILPQSITTQIGFFAVAIFYGFGTVMVSIFPYDSSFDKELNNPSLSNLIHNFIGMLTYLVVPISLIIIGFAARNWKLGKNISLISILCGIISMLFVGILSAEIQSKYVGLYQRIIEGSILVWIVTCSFYLKSYNKN